MNRKYNENMGLPHHVSKTRPQMPMSDRAAQFAPFAALTGYDAAKQRAYFEQRNNVKAGEQLELLMPDGQLLPFVLEAMQDEEGAAIDCAPHAQKKFSAHSDVDLLPFSLLRRKVVK